MNIKTFVSGLYRTNVYVVYDDSKEAFVVDPGYADERINSFIKEQGLKVTYIILTHGHGDHTEGIDSIRRDFPDAVLAASIKEKDFLMMPRARYAKSELVCDRYVDDGEEMDIASMHLRFISTPGHTPGGQCIYVNGVLFSGDTLFFGSVGRSDLKGGNAEDLIRSIREKLFVLPDDTPVYPGHMSETRISYEKRNNPYV